MVKMKNLPRTRPFMKKQARLKIKLNVTVTLNEHYFSTQFGILYARAWHVS